MIKQAPVSWKDMATFISSVGKENIIATIPLTFGFSQKGLTTYNGKTHEIVGNAIIDKYLVVYDY